VPGYAPVPARNRLFRLNIPRKTERCAPPPAIAVSLLLFLSSGIASRKNHFVLGWGEPGLAALFSLGSGFPSKEVATSYFDGNLSIPVWG